MAVVCSILLLFVYWAFGTVDVNFKDSFARCVDMFDGRDEAAVQAARQRWKDGKAAGHTTTYWQQGERGGWTEAG